MINAKHWEEKTMKNKDDVSITEIRNIALALESMIENQYLWCDKSNKRRLFALEDAMVRSTECVKALNRALE